MIREIKVKRMNRRLGTNRIRKQIGVDKRILDFNYAPQWDTMACWAAVTQLNLRLHGLYVHQQDLSYDLCGPDEYRRIDNCPATPRQMNFYLNGCGHDNYGVEYCVKSEVRHDKLNAQDIFNELSKGYPIIIFYKEPGAFVGHASLLTGAEVLEDMDTGNGVMFNLIIRDPADTPENRRRRGRRLVPYELFTEKIYAWWAPRVYETTTQFRF